MNLRFRIITCNDDDYKYEVEKKGWLFWKSLTKHRSIPGAEEYIKEQLRKYHAEPTGTVVKEYTSEDFLVDKLKGNT